MIVILYRRSTCNETDTELLVVLVGPNGGAGVTATLEWTILVLKSLCSQVKIKLDISSCVEVVGTKI